MSDTELKGLGEIVGYKTIGRPYKGSGEFLLELQKQAAQYKSLCSERLNKAMFPPEKPCLVRKLNSPWIETQTAKIVCLNLMECIYHD